MHLLRSSSHTLAAACTTASLLFAGPALAQQSSLVTVEIQNVANTIAQNLSVDVSQIPLTVQVPVGVAANVCGIDANVLAEQARGRTGACTANSTTSALDQTVQQQIKKP